MNKNTYPISARPETDPRKVDGLKGSEKTHGAVADSKSIYDIAKDVVSNKTLKGAEFPTIGSQEFDKGFNATSFVKGFDPQNISGSIKSALDIVNLVKQNAGGVGKLPGDLIGENLFSKFQQLTQALKSNNKELLEIIEKEIEKINEPE
jgi:hypothetical protein